MSKFTLALAFGAGYVVGARAGRGRYEQIRSSAKKVAANPRVHAAAETAKEKASEVATTVAETAKDKVSGVAESAKDKVSRQTSISAAP